jgi:hypothetical protein
VIFVFNRAISVMYSGLSPIKQYMKYLKSKFRTMAASLLCIGSAMLPNLALADEMTERTSTAFIFADYGLGTYKSKLVDSNDTMNVVTYGFGANAGEERNLGFEYRQEKQAITFAVNESSLISDWTSTIFKYRFWMMELGAVIGGVKMKVEREGAEVLDIVGDGYGGYFGLLIPMSRGNLAYLNAMSVATASPVDKKERVIAMGSRLDIEVGGHFAISRKYLNFDVGYRRRANSITEGGTAYNELQTTTFLGFSLGHMF